MKSQQSYYPRKGDKNTEWFAVNAEGLVLGRLASEVAKILRGKHKPTFTDSVDMGDHVIVYNAEKIVVTGRKDRQKNYYSHSLYPGGLKKLAFFQLLAKDPEKIVYKAVQGMLPRNSLGRKMLKKLRVYKGTEHDHDAQKPIEKKLG